MNSRIESKIEEMKTLQEIDLENINELQEDIKRTVDHYDAYSMIAFLPSKIEELNNLVEAMDAKQMMIEHLESLLRK